jgi:hypothetical protein
MGYGNERWSRLITVSLSFDILESFVTLSHHRILRRFPKEYLPPAITNSRGKEVTRLSMDFKPPIVTLPNGFERVDIKVNIPEDKIPTRLTCNQKEKQKRKNSNKTVSL